MTKEDILNIIKNDPLFKNEGKSAVVTLYESPFDNVQIYDEGFLEITKDNESFIITEEELDRELGMTSEAFISNQFLISSKRLTITAYISPNDGNVYLRDPNGFSDLNINSYALVAFVTGGPK